MSVEAAAGYLRHVLTEPGPARAAWRRHDQRGDGRLNRSALARVIAEHLWEVGERDDRDRRLPRKLKDRVRRAIGGPPSPGWTAWT